MLGESAVTKSDASRYAGACHGALEVLAPQTPSEMREIFARPSISVKLLALHPCYVLVQRERVFRELLPVLVGLGARARATNIALTSDAEEAERLYLMLDVFEALGGASELRGWN